MWFVFVCVRQRDRFRGHLFSITTILGSDWLKSCRSVITRQNGENTTITADERAY